MSDLIKYDYLSDGEHRLSLQYNVQISSFKTIIQEQKIETIGGKYPFFVRNGNLRYKEFPITGLISMEMESLGFPSITNSTESAKRTFTPALMFNTPTAGELVAAEREFKIAVYDWLSNGQYKLFHSETEGDYIVQLTNVSLSPEKTLGRRLHSFSATAIEVADYTDEMFAALTPGGVVLLPLKETFRLNNAGLSTVTVGNTAYVDGEEALEIGNGLGNICLPGSILTPDTEKLIENLMVVGYPLTGTVANKTLYLTQGKLDNLLTHGWEYLSVMFVKDYGGVGGGIAVIDPASINVTQLNTNGTEFNITIPNNNEIDGVYLSINKSETNNPILYLRK